MNGKDGRKAVLVAFHDGAAAHQLSSARRAHASWACDAGCASGSDKAAWCRSSSLMESNARQSVFGGCFGRSLYLV